jgi:hypothetical protein
MPLKKSKYQQEKTLLFRVIMATACMYWRVEASIALRYSPERVSPPSSKLTNQEKGLASSLCYITAREQQQSQQSLTLLFGDSIEIPLIISSRTLPSKFIFLGLNVLVGKRENGMMNS